MTNDNNKYLENTAVPWIFFFIQVTKNVGKEEQVCIGSDETDQLVWYYRLNAITRNHYEIISFSMMASTSEKVYIRS